jgi:hypothetical protein
MEDALDLIDAGNRSGGNCKRLPLPKELITLRLPRATAAAPPVRRKRSACMAKKSRLDPLATSELHRRTGACTAGSTKEKAPERVRRGCLVDFFTP